ncbi:MAG: 6-bladed beta-propeller [Rikenellaceae bacterium]
MRKIKLTAIALSLLLLSCTPSNKTNTNAIKIKVTQQELKFSDIFSSYERIEFKGKMMADIINIIKVAKGYVVQTSNRAPELLLFDNGGQFISSIVNIGRGRDEVLNIMDIYYDSKAEQIEILADFGMKVLIYSLNNSEIVDKFDLPQSIFVARSLSKLDDDRYVFYKDDAYDDSENYKVLVYNRASDTIEQKFIHFINIESISFSQSNNLYKNGDDVIFYEAFLDKGYRISRDTITEYFTFDKGSRAVPENQLNREHGDLMDFVDMCTANNYIYGHINCYEYNDMIFSLFRHNEESYINIANLNKCTSESYTSINDDLVSGEAVNLPAYFVIASDEQGLYLSQDLKYQIKTAHQVKPHSNFSQFLNTSAKIPRS